MITQGQILYHRERSRNPFCTEGRRSQKRNRGKKIKGVRMLVRVVTSGSKSEWEIEVPRWVWGLKNKGLCAPFSSSGKI